MLDALPDRDTEESLSLVEDVIREAAAMPKLMVPAEFAAVGPLLFLLVGGRDGVDAYRHGVIVDDEVFIPLYRETLASLLAEVPGLSVLNPLVEAGIAQDHRENAALLAALELLDPVDGSRPRLAAATRFTVPAALHAAAKFALLTPALLPAAGVAGGLMARRLLGRG